jgi:SAM-dependent MidA family methyltransferase
VRQVTGWGDLPGIRGLILSNELLDAMPIQRFGWNRSRQRWFEWGVGLDAGRFVWQPVPGDLLSREVGVPEELEPVLPDGLIHETSEAALQWWRSAAAVLQAGWLATFDYGYPDSFSPERLQGTLRSYRHHSVSLDVLEDPGDQDLTAHVDFARIQQAGESGGLKTTVFEPQGRYLSRILCGMIETGAWRETNPKLAAQLQTLTHPQHLGAAFKVLVQERPPAGP